jgi:hypothetical protein
MVCIEENELFFFLKLDFQLPNCAVICYVLFAGTEILSGQHPGKLFKSFKWSQWRAIRTFCLSFCDCYPDTSFSLLPTNTEGTTTASISNAGTNWRV